MTAKMTRDSASQLAMLDELKAVAGKLGLQVREERLLREVGYRVRSGSCRVGGDEIIFLDRGLPVAVQIDILADELANRSLEHVYLSPAVRALVEGVAGKEASDDGGSESLGS